MRWEEALKIKQKWTAEQARNDLERLIVTGERPADKVVGLACEALDKQIPKKPKFYDTKFRQRGQKYGEYVTIEKAYDCPKCNCTVWEKDKSKHCDNCGQALDWSDTE